MCVINWRQFPCGKQEIRPHAPYARCEAWKWLDSDRATCPNPDGQQVTMHKVQYACGDCNECLRHFKQRAKKRKRQAEESERQAKESKRHRESIIGKEQKEANEDTAKLIHALAIAYVESEVEVVIGEQNKQGIAAKALLGLYIAPRINEVQFLGAEKEREIERRVTEAIEKAWESWRQTTIPVEDNFIDGEVGLEGQYHTSKEPEHYVRMLESSGQHNQGDRLSTTNSSKHGLDTCPSNSRSNSRQPPNSGNESPKCPIPGCGLSFEDPEAHIQGHHSDRPEKCPLAACLYYHKGFESRGAQRAHIRTHYLGSMACCFCPGAGTASKETFKKADALKRHLIASHGACHSTCASLPVTAATAICSICSAPFRNVQTYHDHVDDCVIRAVTSSEKQANLREA
ncbi:hypothetical protein MMC28_004599 [Mycoblastus sanguinarius]|nr:hypothetical protein [Mycoblastus sanguinarius]